MAEDAPAGGPLGIVGGSGLAEFPGLERRRTVRLETPFGPPSGAIAVGRLGRREVAFLPRHGPGHTVAPHRINYRANVWALGELGVREIVAVAAVGGIAPALAPETIVLPDQIIDYTWGRAHTFYDEEERGLAHVDFTEPYSARLRARLRAAARALGIPVHDGGAYGATQGPRLESAAEIDRMERDGCDVVGMTGMPEAGLARELGIEYAACALVVNRAAGRGSGPITAAAIEASLARGMAEVRRLVEGVAETGPC